MEDNKPVPSEVPTDDRRAAIEAAFEAAEEKEVEATEHVADETHDDIPVAEEVTESAPEAVEHEADHSEPVETDEEVPEPVEKEHVEKPVDIKRAPQGWKPEARETWADLPDSAKREIVRREREIATTLQQSAQERRFASEINNVFKPYEAELRSAGVGPKDVLQDLLNTSYVLRRGNTTERAQLVANIINAHGVDLVSLNDMLMKKAPAQASNDPTAQRLAQLEAAEQARQRAAQESQVNMLNKEIDAFASNPKHEFFHDVAPMMVAFLEKGQAATLEDAYEKAVWAHPETRKVLTSRQNKTSQTQSKLAAASSVRGSGPTGAAAPVKKLTGSASNDRRSAIAAAFDELTTGQKRF